MILPVLRIRGMPRSFRVSVLIALALAATACGSGAGQASLAGDVPVPEPGDVPGLTAQEIADISVIAAEAFVTVQAEGGFLTYATGEDLRSAGFRREWTAPNRSRLIATNRTTGGTNITEVITIGDRTYQRPGFGTEGWQEFHNDGESSGSMPIELLSQISVEEPAEVVEWNGSTAYRITGRRKARDPADSETMRDFGVDWDFSDVVFIDATSFLVLRHERTQTIESTEEVDDPEAPGGRRSVEQVTTVESWFEFTYFDEPLVIEPPGEYLPVITRDDGPPHTPTPFAGIPAPSPVSATATPTLTAGPSGSDPGPVIGAPLPSPVPPTVADQFDHVPYYDRLDIGDITVIFKPCDPSSITDGPPILIVHMPTGSAAFQPLESGGRAFRYGSTFEYRGTSQAGIEALESFLGNSGLMSVVIDRSPRPERCPPEFADLERASLFNLPARARFIIDLDTVARFEFCETVARHLPAPVVVTHIPTESVVGIRPGDPALMVVSYGTPSGHQHLERILSDTELATELLRMAPREARCS